MLDRTATARYLVVVALTVAAVFGGTLAPNVAVDPLWYDRGNRLTGVNFGFDERIGKTNQFLRDPKGYDCLLLGSSRATFLDVSKIGGQRCFNYSVSAGMVGEFIDFARYTKGRGIEPSLVIADVSEFAFRHDPAATSTPEFVLRGEDPPPMLRSYLSFASEPLRVCRRLLLLRGWSHEGNEALLT